MIVTPDNLKELLEAGMSLNGAWNSAQLRALLPKEKFNPDGFPCCGWKQRLIGQKLTESQIDEFLRLKNKHLAHKKRDLPGQKTFESEMYSHLASIKAEIRSA